MHHNTSTIRNIHQVTSYHDRKGGMERSMLSQPSMNDHKSPKMTTNDHKSPEMTTNEHKYTAKCQQWTTSNTQQRRKDKVGHQIRPRIHTLANNSCPPTLFILSLFTIGKRHRGGTNGQKWNQIWEQSDSKVTTKWRKIHFKQIL